MSRARWHGIGRSGGGLTTRTTTAERATELSDAGAHIVCLTDEWLSPVAEVAEVVLTILRAVLGRLRLCGGCPPGDLPSPDLRPPRRHGGGGRVAGLASGRGPGCQHNAPLHPHRPATAS